MRWTALLVFLVVSGCGDTRPTTEANEDSGPSAERPDQAAPEGREDNQAPRFESVPSLTAREGGDYVYEASVVDPDGDALVVTLESGPEFVIFDGARRSLRWTPEQGQAGAQRFVLLASDGLAETRQEFEVDVEDVNLAPRFLSSPERCAARGEQYRAALEAYDPDDTSLTFEVAKGPSGMRVEGKTLVWNAELEGPHEVELVVRDPKGTEARQSYLLGVSGFGSSSSPPVTSLSMATTMTESSPVIGTASSPALLYYELSLARLPGGEERVFYTGVEPIIDGELGRFPASSVANGSYRVRLEARDMSCAASSVATELEVTGGAKLGVTQYEHIDMEIHTGNLNLRVERAYDSKDLSSRDLGHGWVLTAFEMAPTETAPPGEGWSLAGGGGPLSGYGLDGVSSTIDIPLGEDVSLRFRFVPRFETSIDPTFTTFDYVDEYGSGATLTCLDCPSSLYFDASSGALLDAETFQAFRPRQFEARTAAGVKALIDLDRGLREITDRNGNSVHLDENSIMHEAGAGFRFERENGLIVAAIGPDGRRVEYIYDEHDDLRRVIYPDGTEERYAYAAHLLTRVSDAEDNQILRNEHDEEGRLVHQIAPTGDENFFTYDTDARVTTIEDGAGHVQTTRYGERGEILEETDVLGNVTTFEYDDRGRLTHIAEPDGSDVQRAYGDESTVASEVIDGESTSYRYDDGELVGVDGDDADLSADLDDRGNLTSIDAAGADIDYENDDSGNLTDVTLADGSRSHAEFDALGRPTRLEDASGEETTIEYDAYGNPQSVETPQGREEHTRDASGREVARVDSSGEAKTFTYDSLGRVASETSASGTLAFGYDRLGRVRRTTFSDGTSELYAYDATGNMVAKTTRNGGVTQMEYDAAGQVSRELRADGSTWSYERDSSGEVTRVTDGAGSVWITERDADGRVTRSVDPTGHETHTRYAPEDPSAMGAFVRIQGPVAIEDSLGRTTRFEHSAAGVETARVFPDGSRFETEYDDVNHVVAERDEEGRRRGYVTDADGRPTEIHEANGRVTAFEWLPDGRPTAVIDGRGQRTSYGFEGGLLTEETLALGDVRTIRYESGRPVEETGFDGETTVHRYDAQGRLSTTASQGSTIEREWAPAGESAVTIDGARYELVRNSADQIVRAVFPSGEEIRYGYDQAGRVVRIATPYDTIAYEYDAAGRLVRSTNGAGATALVYDVAGRRVATIYASGATSRAEFNDRDWVTRLVHMDASGAIVADLRYTYDRSGRVTELAEGDGSRTAFRYDDAGDLVGEVRTGTAPYSRTYELDLAGNRHVAVIDGVRTVYEHDENNRITTKTSPAGTTLYTYNNAGRLLEEEGPEGHVRYGYHPITGQLVSIDRDGETTTITYDAWGNFREIDRAGRIERFIIDPLRGEGLPTILTHEIDGNRTSFNATPFGIMGAMGANAAVPLADAAGTTRVVLDGAGVAAGRITRTAFGETIAQTGAPFDLAGFQAEPTIDGSLDLVWMGMRAYDARTGRFTARDPMSARPQSPVTANAYNFASNDPLRFSDPIGTSDGLIGMVVNIGVRMGQAAWKAGSYIASGVAAVARLAFSLIWRGLQLLARLRNPGRWLTQLNGQLRWLQYQFLFAQARAGGGCGGLALFALAKHLGYGTRMFTAITRLLNRIPSFRNDGAIRNPERFFTVMRRLMGVRAEQVASGSRVAAVNQAQATSQMAANGQGMYMVSIVYRNGAGQQVSSHVMFGVGGRSPYLANWVGPRAGQTAELQHIYRLTMMRGCSVVVVETSEGGVYVFAIVLVVVVVRRRRRR